EFRIRVGCQSPCDIVTGDRADRLHFKKMPKNANCFLLPCSHHEKKTEIDTGVCQSAAKFRMWKSAHGLLGHVKGLAEYRFRLRKAPLVLAIVADMVINKGQSRGSPRIGWKLGPHRVSFCDGPLERLLGVLRSAGVFQH